MKKLTPEEAICESVHQRKMFEINENKHAVQKSVENCKDIPGGKVVAINACIKKRGKKISNNISLYCKEL